ncbi:MAG: diguanylate cyclase [Gemmatirosa sp.]
MLDAIGRLTHLVGAYAHDTDSRTAADVRCHADRWRRHLTTGLGHPTRDGDEDATDGSERNVRGGGLAARDWEGAVRFAAADRQAEHAYVARTLEALRGTVWTLVQGLHAAVGAEAAAGRASAGVVRRLQHVVCDAEPEVLRDAALAAVGELGTLLARREREREQQIAALGREVATLGAALEEARRESATDPLTGLGNRRAFDAALAHAAALHGLWGQRVCLVQVDVDLLKHLNDRDGHAAGDAALKRVAAQLSRIFLRRTDVVARTGGDEFAVLLRDTTVDEATRLAERLVAAVAAAFVDEDSRISVSAGVAALRTDETAAEWYARADAALYAAKAAGRGRVERSG